MTLLPCPFCGERLVEKHDQYLTWCAHEDEGGPCIMHLVTLFDDADKRQWNTRALLTAEGLRAALDTEAASRLIASLFENVRAPAELPAPARDFVVRHKEEAHRNGWQAGFTEGLARSTGSAAEPRFHVAEQFATPAQIEGFGVGDIVEIVASDQVSTATVVAVFSKLWGAARFVVEDQKRVQHIYGAKSLRKLEAAPAPAPDERSAANDTSAQLNLIFDAAGSGN